MPLTSIKTFHVSFFKKYGDDIFDFANKEQYGSESWHLHFFKTDDAPDLESGCI